MTRALGRLTVGDFAGAFDFHPLFGLVLILAVGGAGWLAGNRYRGWRPLPTPALHGGLALVGLAFLGVWLLRLTTGTLPPV